MFQKLFFTLTMLCLFSNSTFADTGDNGDEALNAGPPPIAEMLAETLSLTDEQKVAVETIFANYRATLDEQRSAVELARSALRTASMAEEFNEEAVRVAAKALAAVEEEMSVTRAKIHAEISAILTDEQRAQAEALEFEKPPHRGHHGKFPGEKPPTF